MTDVNESRINCALLDRGLTRVYISCTDAFTLKRGGVVCNLYRCQAAKLIERFVFLKLFFNLSPSFL